MREWLKTKRQEAGLTMAELAEKLDLTESYYSRIESGDRQRNMSILLVDKLAEVLGMTVDQIVELEREGGGR